MSEITNRSLDISTTLQKNDGGEFRILLAVRGLMSVSTAWYDTIEAATDEAAEHQARLFRRLIVMEARYNDLDKIEWEWERDNRLGRNGA